MTEEERRRAVRLLLASMYDYMPPTGGRLRGAISGPAPSRHRPCETCGGTGRVRARGPSWAVGVQVCVTCRTACDNGKPIRRPGHGCKPCLACDGAGRLRARRHDPGWDEYAGKPLDELQRELRDARIDERPRRLTLRDTPDPERDELPWLRLRARYRAHGSYEELERAIGTLRARYPGRAAGLLLWASAGEGVPWSGRALAEVEESVRLVAGLMEGPVRVPGWVRGSGPGSVRGAPGAPHEPSRNL